MNPEHSPNPEAQEYGNDVTIMLKIMRHGDREGRFLVDSGRAATRERARESGLKKEDFGAVKAIGSPVNPNPEHPKQYGRALETADLYADEIASDEKFVTRAQQVLNYEHMKTPAPHNHLEIYNAALPPNFDKLSSYEKVQASKHAQSVASEHIFSLHTSEAETFKREIAGAFAYLIDHYQKVGKRIHAHSRVLIPAGTHSPMPEFLLFEEALVRRQPDGTEKRGFKTGAEFGGAFDPSEAMTIAIATDDRGEEQSLRVTFDNPERPQEEMYLDPIKLQELKDFYLALHRDQEPES